MLLTLALGERADLVLLRSNPLDDIAQTRNIVAVYMDGEKVSWATAGTGGGIRTHMPCGRGV